MKLIVLYGPPASGKYTIAKALSEKLGYRLFHNHMTVDLLSSIFTFGTSEFFKLSDKIRLEIIEEAAKQDIPGMVFTFVYLKEGDDQFIKELLSRINNYGVDIQFIQIYSNKEALLRRVKESSRRKFKKISSKEGLLKILKSGDRTSSISFVNSKKINTTNLTIDESVFKVLELIDS